MVSRLAIVTLMAVGILAIVIFKGSGGISNCYHDGSDWNTNAI